MFIDFKIFSLENRHLLFNYKVNKEINIIYFNFYLKIDDI